MDFLPQCYHGVFVSEDFIAFEINLRFEDCGGEEVMSSWELAGASSKERN